ncbi:MAG: hypothetical protein JRJ87_13830 [Deltaproteobacteria bacterium]|nr:hypothetical protein [Deltaproteobacteria bacterium]
MDTGNLAIVPTSVWGTRADDVYAVGPDGIAHYDGHRWSDFPINANHFGLSDIWSADGREIHVIGHLTLLHYDGFRWHTLEHNSWRPSALWGAASDDVWAVGLDAGPGADSLLIHWDGRGWTPIIENRGRGLLDIWGSSVQDIYAVGNRGSMLHYNGLTWSDVIPAITGDASAVWGISANDIFVAVGSRDTELSGVMQYDGQSWSTISYSIEGNISELWGSSVQNMWGVGEHLGDGFVIHFDGEGWNLIIDRLPYLLRSIWGASPTNVFAVGGQLYGEAHILHCRSPLLERCNEIDCSNHGVCEVTNGEPSCICHPGYVADGLECVAQDACTGVDCSFHGRCILEGLDAACECDPGFYAADLSCVDGLELCSDIDCNGNGWCVPTAIGPTCECYPGYEPVGLSCQPGPCAGEMCGCHGTCLVNGDVPECNCDPGYHADGLDCLPDEIPCFGVSCSGHGTCDLDPDGRVLCACDPGFKNGSRRTCIEQPADSNHVCTGEDWCWLNPLPQGSRLRAVWGTGPNSVWAVGDAGSIVHWDGVEWTAAKTPTRQLLHGIWGFSDGVLWAVGEGGTTLRYDPQQSLWEHFEVGSYCSLNDVWGSTSGDVWAVGESCILHWDGDAWHEAAVLDHGISLRGIWGVDQNDIWAAGSKQNQADGGSGSMIELAFFHWDGLEWQRVTGGGMPSFRASDVWASATNDVWIVGSNEALYHWDGETWQAHDVEQGTYLVSIWGSGPEDIWIFGSSGARYHWDGSTWQKHGKLADVSWLGKAWGSAQDNVWVVGGEKTGIIYKFDGSDWARVDSGHGQWLNDVWGHSSDEVWIAGSDGLLLHWTDASNLLSRIDLETDESLTGIWGWSENDIVVVGSGGSVFRREGDVWNRTTIGGEPYLLSLWGTGPDDLWAVSANTMPPFPNTGTVYHWDGGRWSIVFQTDVGRLRDVFGVGCNDVWTASDSGVALHFDGSGWSEWTVPDTSVLHLWGGRGDTVRAGTGNRRVFRWAPSSQIWTEDEVDLAPSYKGIIGLSGLSSDHMWAVGGGGIILRWDAGADIWQSVETGINKRLNAVWVAPSGDVWVVGEEGTVLRHRP